MVTSSTKLEYLSTNLATIIKKLVSIQEIVQYLSYTDKNPLALDAAVLPANSLLMDKVFPTPFYPNTFMNPDDPLTDRLEIHVYYPRGDFTKNGVVNQVQIYFDIVCAKSIWLCGDEKIRPYEVAKYIIRNFDGVSVEEVGVLEFKTFSHVPTNPFFDTFRLIAEMKQFGQ